jgi:hypothetical protein
VVTFYSVRLDIFEVLVAFFVGLDISEGAWTHGEHLWSLSLNHIHIDDAGFIENQTEVCVN